MIEVQVLGVEAIRAKIRRTTPSVIRQLLIGMERACIILQQYVKFQKLSGGVLKNRTGTLRRSINYKVKQDGEQVVGTVGTNVSYGRVHELGLTIPAHVVEAVRGKALAFNWRGKPAFYKRVKIPAVTMPKRSFLASSMQEQKSKLFGILQEAAAKGLKEA